MQCSWWHTTRLRVPLQGKKRFTYGNPVVDYRPQKEFPHCIRITAGGNLIKYESSASVRMADLDMANSIGTAWSALKAQGACV
jgi:hypothetical protein